ncbi:hypothetical protein TrVE_jg7534 [Triparma verrucosa]|uniref:thermospermine synthase n=2 Tax=Triparma TaxID=722752 RepID=A0A9W7AMJ8_9STRA|nr:hypothetical protein TrST_g2257 [Triparma strigata]GMH92251.1 hypothetical protein TrVE_jg7534 [Triparma verrucosa]
MSIEAEREKAGFWFSEETGPDSSISLKLHSILFSGSSPYQSVSIIKTSFGRTLVTDGKTQSCENDEKIYHESLVLPPLLKHGSPKKIFIGGGGELATARECLRIPSVEKVVMVDIDEAVVKMCIEHLPEWGEECWSDPRLEIIYGDAYENFDKIEEDWDVIIMDISDPIEAGPGIKLYTKEFYDMAKNKLSPGGVFVTQSGCGAVNNWDDCWSSIHKTLEGVFETVVPYRSNIPSFACPWAFTMAFEGPLGDFKTGVGVDEMIERLGPVFKGKQKEYEYYDEETHRHMFSLEKQVRKGLKEEKRVITMDNPVFMF